MEPRTYAGKIKAEREINPFAAIFAPGLAAKCFPESARQDFLLKTTKMLAHHARVLSHSRRTAQHYLLALRAARHYSPYK
jgi:hypothetical protein